MAILKVDSWPTDPQNIAGKILDYKHGVYQAGTKYRVLKGWFGHDALVCHANVNLLKEAVAETPGGKAVAKWACKLSKQQSKN